MRDFLKSQDASLRKISVSGEAMFSKYFGNSKVQNSILVNHKHLVSNCSAQWPLGHYRLKASWPCKSFQCGGHRWAEEVYSGYFMGQR